MKTFITLAILSFATVSSAQEIDFNYTANIQKVFKEDATLNYPYSQIDLIKQREHLSLKVGQQCLNLVKDIKRKWETFALENDFATNDLSISVSITDQRFLELDAKSNCTEKYGKTGSVANCTATFDCKVNFKSKNAALFVGSVQKNKNAYINHHFSIDKTRSEIKQLKKDCEKQQLEMASQTDTLYLENTKNSVQRDSERDLKAYHYSCHNNLLKLKERIR